MRRVSPSTRFALALALFLAASLPGTHDAAAQTDAPAVVPPELSEDARRAYAQGLKAVRELIARQDYLAAAARIDALPALPTTVSIARRLIDATVARLRAQPAQP